MSYGSSGLVNWATFSQARAQLGTEFVRILGYFREDGVKSLLAIEDAMRAKDAAALVRPAHTLKGESLQFGAEPLGLLAEHIEHSARKFVEEHQKPDSLADDVAKLRPLLNETITLFDRETAQASPAAAIRRPAVFGRKTG